MEQLMREFNENLIQDVQNPVEKMWYSPQIINFAGERRMALRLV